MTSQVKGTIIHNFPVYVELVDTPSGSRTLIKEAKLEETQGSFEIDLWFHDNQQVVIREVPKETE